jgi:hypothetical protein
MSDAQALDQRVRAILDRRSHAPVGRYPGPTAAAVRDAWLRERDAALTGRWVPAPAQVRATLAALRRPKGDPPDLRGDDGD